MNNSGTVNNITVPNYLKHTIQIYYVEGFFASSQNLLQSLRINITQFPDVIISSIRYHSIYLTAITNPMRLVVGILFGSQLYSSLYFTNNYSRNTHSHIKIQRQIIYLLKTVQLYLSLNKTKRIGSRDSKTKDNFFAHFSKLRQAKMSKNLD